MDKPQPNDYAPFSAGYIGLASKYDDIIGLLNQLKTTTHQLFSNLPPEKGDYAYGPGKWTLKQMLGHMIDTERIFAYRAYCISRGDQNPFPGFEQDDYVANSNFNSRSLQSLADEFKLVRESNLCFINALTETQIARAGTASNHRVTVHALLFMIAGHELHHLNILHERYL